MNTLNKHQYLFNGIVSGLLACTGGAVLVIEAAHAAGLSRTALVSWLFAAYFLAGLVNIALPLIFKLPMAGAHSITAAAFLGTAAAHFTLSELAGSYILSGVLILLIGLTGIFAKFMNLLPKPIIAAMLTGLVAHYVIKIIPALQAYPLAGTLSVLGFLLTSRYLKKIPPIISVLVLGIFGLWAGQPGWEIPELHFVWPQLVIPSFSVQGFISIAVPVALLILSNDVAVAIAALQQNGYKAPIMPSLLVSGLGTSLAAFFGGHAITVGGMMTALCSSEDSGPMDRRFRAALVSGTFVTLFGLFAWAVIDLLTLLPQAFISLIAGFSLLQVLITNAHFAFSAQSYRYSVMAAFIVSISDVSFAGISSPVWSLLIGTAIAWVLGEQKAEVSRGAIIPPPSQQKKARPQKGRTGY